MGSSLNGSWQLTVRGEFSAAHALRNYKGKCERLHGHNFAVSLTVAGEKLSEDTGILVDFAVLKKILASVLEPLDHRVLNETPPFDAINPSSEQLASHIGLRAADALQRCPEAAHARVYSVSISEKGAQTAMWLAPQPSRP